MLNGFCLSEKPFVYSHLLQPLVCASYKVTFGLPVRPCSCAEIVGIMADISTLGLDFGTLQYQPTFPQGLEHFFFIVSYALFKERINWKAVRHWDGSPDSGSLHMGRGIDLGGILHLRRVPPLRQVHQGDSITGEDSVDVLADKHTVREATYCQHIPVLREECQCHIWRSFSDHQMHCDQALEYHCPC